MKKTLKVILAAIWVLNFSFTPCQLKAQIISGNKVVVLWGMTSRGGTNDKGVIFKYNMTNNTYSKVLEFDGTNGAEPTGSLLHASNGRFYGTTSKGGRNNSGVVFEYDPISDRYSYINLADISGKYPFGSLIQASDDKLYGMTNSGGINGKGSIFTLSVNNSGGYGMTATNLLSFDGINGSYPLGDLYEASNGLLYGMTSGGLGYGKGTIFYLNKTTGQLVKVKDLDENIGNEPLGSFMQATDGQLYGMTNSGGSSDAGVLFKLTTIGFSIHSYVKKTDFSAETGHFPKGSLIQANDGLLYGMTSLPAKIFSFDYSTNQLNVLHSFASGTEARGSLTLSSDGKTLYGLTTTGGSYGNGMIYKYVDNKREVLFSFTQQDGVNPYYTRVIEIVYDDFDNDQIPDDFDECPGTGTGVEVNEKGCAQSQLDDDNDGVMNGVDICPNTPESETANASGCSQSQITYIPDANFEKVLIAQGIDSDGRVNQQVLTSDVSEIKSLMITSGDVSDLTGLQSFSSLESLICVAAQLSELDISQNLLLNYLDCSNNQLSELNVSNNTKLEILIFGSNQLTTLDVSENVLLKQLSCGNNPIYELNLDKNEALLKLYCKENKLSGLDLSNNLALEYLNCSENDLTELNINQNASLEYLDCSVNELDKLDVTQNSLLTSFNCSNNKLTSLDLSQNPVLNTIICSHNNITELDVNQSTGLELLYCSNNQLTKLYVKNQYLDFFEAKDNPNLSCIEVYDAEAANAGKGIYYEWRKDETAVYSEDCYTSQDSDGDGIPDDNDYCMGTPEGEEVDEYGCSQSQYDDDTDGIMNNADICPNTPLDEFANNQGCSPSQLDSDNDGVTDNLDECPDTPQDEPVDEKGCPVSVPDDDNDGIPNESDLCPNTPTDEAVNAQGCSQSQIDSDNDGVKDNMDECPNTLQDELVNSKGCPITVPDDDNDGIPNESDLCPNTPIDEAANAQGCSQSQIDSDNDGVMDNMDECPDTPQDELVNSRGCPIAVPDDDNDGIPNESDLCPNTPIDEAANAQGCSQCQIDSDNDGVMDNMDECLDTPLGIEVNEFGCQLTPINYTAIPDSFFEQALIDLGIDTDKILNKKVATGDIAEIESLDVRNKNINDLTGIEEFISLTYLNCMENNLTELNVTNNTLLTHLNCNTNQLSELDVSNNTLLSYFNCSVNQITSLDLSNNSNLTGFYCTTNQLNSLNVKNGNNQTLTGFAALDNLMLNCIEVDDPFAANKGTGVYASWQKNMVASYSDDCTAELDDDKDGILNKDDLCPETNAIIPVDSFGCPLQSNVLFSETFEDCEEVQFFSYNESSNKNWQCQDVYGEDNSGCMSMNGYKEDTPSKDWLITNSPIDFVSYAKEKLSFYVHAQYGSTQLRLLYSLDYDGFGNPANFNWDSVPNVSIPIHSTGTSEKEIHNFKGIDISAIPGEAYLAFQYYSNSNTTRWNVDNFIITTDDDKDSDDDDDGIMNDVDVCNNTKRGERVNNDGCSVTGSSNNKISELNVYPNPTTNIIKITGLDDSKTHLIRLYDSLGKELINKEVITREAEVDMIEFISGIYYILIRNEDASFSIKIIKN